MLLGCVIAWQVCHAAPPPVRRRGKLLRTELLRTERKPFFACALIHAVDCKPRLLFTKHEALTFHEVPIYEILLEYKGAGETDRSKIIYKSAKDEAIRGKQTMRTDSIELGVCAGETFTINGTPVTTDADGIAVDQTQALVRLFDPLAKRQEDITLSHGKLGSVALTISREIVRKTPFKPSGDDTAATSDLLESLGTDFGPIRRPARDGVRLDAAFPNAVRPGSTVSIEVTAVNGGDGHACRIMARTVSRHAWLDGMNFYLGNLEPGQTRSFSRQIVVPADQAAGTVFGAVGFWDVLGAIPEQAVPLEIDVRAP